MASSLRCKPVASRMRQAPSQTSMLDQESQLGSQKDSKA